MKLPLDTRVWLWNALESERVRLPHRDPADRFLVATARVYGLTLITADEKLLDVRSVPTFSVR